MIRLPSRLKPAILVTIALGTLGLVIGEAWAKSHLSLKNCTDSSVNVCVFSTNSGGTSLFGAVGSVQAVTIPGHGEYSDALSCSNDNGCKVKIVSGDCGKSDGSTLLHEHAWRIKKNGGDYSFEQVDSDWNYFSKDGAHGSCGSTKPLGTTCNTGSECYSGHCYPVGDGTSACCQSDCGSTKCSVCSQKAGWTCQGATYGQQGTGCGGTMMCTGTGPNGCIARASKANGTACTGAAECSSGFCVDNYCCNSACNGVCMSCKVARQYGTCTPTPAGSTDDATCAVGSQACDGHGACLKANLWPCSNDSECGTGICTNVKSPCNRQLKYLNPCGQVCFPTRQ